MTRGRIALLVLAPFVMAVIAVGVASSIPTKYESSALVRVTVVAPQGPTDPTVNAESGIASQFALLTTSGPIIQQASRRLGISESKLKGMISAGTDSGRNLIEIRASSEDQAEAGRAANEVADQLVRAAEVSGRRQSARYTASIELGNRPLDDTIRAYRDLIAKGSKELRSARSQVLASLLAERQRQQSGTTASAVASVPSLEVWARAGLGSESGPSSIVYAFAAFLVTALVAGYIAYLLAPRRQLAA